MSASDPPSSSEHDLPDPRSAAELTDELDELPRGRRRARSPVIAAVVVVLGTWFLVRWFSDFAYWVNGNEPVELGHVADWADPEATLAEQANEFVRFEGTPEFVAPGNFGDRAMRYIRISDLGEMLFAAVPATKAGGTPDLPGAFQGRLQRLEGLPVLAELRSFYAVEERALSVVLEPQSVRSAMAAGSGPWRVSAEDGEIELSAGDSVWIMVRPRYFQLQLGKRSFPDRATAQRRVEELGYAYRALEDGAQFYRFIAAIPEAERASVQQRLSAGLDVDDDKGTLQPDVGALVLPMSLAFSAVLGELTWTQTGIVIPAYSGAPTLHHEDESGKALVPVEPANNTLSIALDDVTSLQWNDPIMPNEQGFFLTGGVEPAQLRIAGLGWLFVLGLTLVNLTVVVLALRRSRQAV